jgi:hypothetical protein
MTARRVRPRRGPVGGGILLVAAALTLSGAGRAVAQELEPEPEPDISAGLTAPVRWELGGALLLAEPLGEFGRYVDGGGGFGLSGVRYFGAARRLGVRADLTLVSYGKVSSTSELVLSGVGVDVDVTTENIIASFAIGPQYVFGRGRVRPWVNASIGSAQFVTTTSAWSGGRPVPIARADVLEHHVLALTAGGGARVALWPGRQRPISLEVDARYHRHGAVEYLREGGVRDLPDGSVTLDPITSDADLWTIRVGAVMGLR